MNILVLTPADTNFALRHVLIVLLFEMDLLVIYKLQKILALP